MQPPPDQGPAPTPPGLQAPEAYLPLLDAVARGTRTELPFEERRQDGYFGLHHALTHYDPQKVLTSFEGYAAKCIKGFILNRTAAAARTVRVPARLFRSGTIPLCLSLDWLLETEACSNELRQCCAPEPARQFPADEHKALWEAFDQLSPREQQAVRMRFGFDPDTEDEGGANLGQIGAALGITGEGSRQLLERALAKLRKALNYQG